MACKFLLSGVFFSGLILVSSPVFAGEPQPQYTVQDLAKTFAAKPAPADASGDDTDSSAPAAANGACESKGKVTGPDGLCYKANNATAGFNLGRKSSKSPAVQIAKKTTPAAVSSFAHAPAQKDLQITFKVGSTELTDQGRANASVFAKALKSVPQLTDAHFQLAGFTDSSGDKDKNLTLSQRRAEAVKAFLVTQGIDGSHLTARGYGAENFLKGIPSSSPDNRRVVATKE